MAVHSARNSLLSFIQLRKYVKYLIYFTFVSTVFQNCRKIIEYHLCKNRFSSYFMRKDGHTDLICVSKNIKTLKLLKTNRNLLYIRNQSVLRSKHFPPRL